MPRSVSFISPVHHKANCARRVTFAQHVRDLSVGHHAARRYAAHDSVDAFAVLPIRLALFRHMTNTSYRSHKSYLLRSTTRAGAPFPSPSTLCRGRHIRSYPPAEIALEHHPSTHTTFFE